MLPIYHPHGAKGVAKMFVFGAKKNGLRFQTILIENASWKL
jgi:hypothetical protein